MTEPAAAPESQAIDQLTSLEDRIVQVVQLLQEARQARQAAEKEAAGLRGELAALRQQLAAHNKERDEVRRRLERLLQQVDSLVSR
jgi:septal ring factor EnvC (AmiA/AmiB activator)